jgi:hypothetical protein
MFLLRDPHRVVRIRSRARRAWVVARIGASVRDRTGVDRLSADCSATELQMRLSLVEREATPLNGASAWERSSAMSQRRSVG